MTEEKLCTGRASAVQLAQRLGGLSVGVFLLFLQGCTPEVGGSNPPPSSKQQHYVMLNGPSEDTGQQPPALKGLQLCSEEYLEQLGVRLCVYKTDCNDPDADGWWDFGCDGFDLNSPGNQGARRPDFSLCHEGMIDGRRACIYQSDCDEYPPAEFQIDFECDGENFVRAVSEFVRQDVAPIDFGRTVQYEYNQFTGEITMEFEPHDSYPVVLPREGNLRMWQVRSSDGTHETVELLSGEIEVGARIRIKATISDFVHWVHAMGIPRIEFTVRGVDFLITRPSMFPTYEVRLDGLVIETVHVDEPVSVTSDATAQDDH